MERLGHGLSRALQGQRAHGQDGAGRAHRALEAGGAQAGAVGAERLLDVLDQARLVLGGEGVALDELLGRAQHAELLADPVLHALAAAHGQLDAAPPDVDDERAAALEVHAVEDGEVDETRFLVAGDGARPDLELGADALEEVLSVRGFADGGSGHGQDLLRPRALGQALVLPQRVQAPRHGRRRELAAREGAGAQADHLLVRADHTERPPAQRLHDYHMKGVAAEVDGGDLH